MKKQKTWQEWLEHNGMETDRYGNFPEDWGQYDPDAETRNSDWFYESYLKWKEKEED